MSKKCILIVSEELLLESDVFVPLTTTAQHVYVWPEVRLLISVELSGLFTTSDPLTGGSHVTVTLSHVLLEGLIHDTVACDLSALLTVIVKFSTVRGAEESKTHQ